MSKSATKTNILTIQDVELAKIVPYERNPRKNAGAIDKVVSSLREFGPRQPIVTDENLVVIVGHTRLEAAKRLGWKTFPVHIAEGLSPAQARAYRLADNRTNEEAGWDPELLAVELEDLRDDGFDLDLTGFDGEELIELLGSANDAGGLKDGVDEDSVPEPPEVPVTQAGDLITLGDHRLLCGDSTSAEDVARLMGGASAGMVYTDPPYGMKVVQSDGKACGQEKGTVGISGACERGTYAPIIGDDSTETAVASFRLCAGLKIPTLIFWGANFYASELPDSSAWIVWDKENGEGFFADVELAWTNLKIQSRIFRHQWKGMIKASERGEKRVHPTQKPVALAQWAFEKFGSVGDKVLDLFGGSGSTLIACEKTARTCYMMEMSPAYCDVIVKRWEDATGNTATRPKRKKG